MAEPDAKFQDVVRRLVEKDPRFRPEAYRFVSEAVGFTATRLQRKPDEENRTAHHISGQELLEGFRVLALERFGCLTRDVLADWGLNRTEDVGEIVFRLVRTKLLGASDQDSPSDFSGGYDFADAFVKPFTPDRTPAGAPDPIA